MRQVRFEPTSTVHALDRAAIVISMIRIYPQFFYTVRLMPAVFSCVYCSEHSNLGISWVMLLLVRVGGAFVCFCSVHVNKWVFTYCSQCVFQILFRS
jgi:hypothetical protein